METCKLRQPSNVRRRGGRPLGRTGASAVEFAFVAPLMIMLTMGMLDVGRMVMVKQLLVNATREGARLAVLPGATTEQVESQVASQLESSSVRGATVSCNPSIIESAPQGSAVTISVQVPATSVSWIPKPLFSMNKDLTASTTMRKESY